MSGYHYGDQSGRDSQRGKYLPLDQTTKYDCNQPCICRFTSERSNRDVMDYDYYVLNKPIDLNATNEKTLEKNKKC